MAKLGRLLPKTSPPAPKLGLFPPLKGGLLAPNGLLGRGTVPSMSLANGLPKAEFRGASGSEWGPFERVAEVNPEGMTGTTSS